MRNTPQQNSNLLTYRGDGPGLKARRPPARCWKQTRTHQDHTSINIILRARCKLRWKLLSWTSTFIEPILTCFSCLLFSSFSNNNAPLKYISDDKPVVVNLSMFLLYFSLKIKSPNLRPESIKELLAAIFALPLDMSAWKILQSYGLIIIRTRLRCPRTYPNLSRC